jgi:predicted DNA-binding transcriptional regulator YafY
MPAAKQKISKTERILRIFHMFRFYKEVSMQELNDSLQGWSGRTFSRDVAILKRAGVPIRFSGRRNAFVLVDENGREFTKKTRRLSLRKPDYPDSKKERQYIDKIIRLITMMADMPGEDCDKWYGETFPEMSKRTMHRDFAVLKSVGYEIKYKREWDDPEYKDDEQPIRRYYFEGVYNA